MEIEYRDDRRRAKFLVVIGVILALVAGGAAFLVMSQAQQQAAHVIASGAAIQIAIIWVRYERHPQAQRPPPSRNSRPAVCLRR